MSLLGSIGAIIQYTGKLSVYTVYLEQELIVNADALSKEKFRLVVGDIIELSVPSSNKNSRLWQLNWCRESRVIIYTFIWL